MKTISLCGMLILFSGLTVISRADHITVTGSVSGEWNTDTVKVRGDLLVEEGNSLFIHPGVLVEFAGPFSFYVGGSINALGSISRKIVFDVADTTGFGIDSIPDGGWNGFQFYYTNPVVDSSIFEFCTFRHGKAVSGDTLENHGGAFCIRYYDKVRISSCLFEENKAWLNGGAIYTEYGNIVILDCGFTGNRCGPAVAPWGYGGALCSDYSDVYCSGNVFTQNSSTGVGGAVALRFRDGRVHGNVFASNYSALGGAIGYLHYYEYPHSQCNNLVYDNTAAFFGGGIACLDAGPTLVNNTITENYSSYGGGLYVKDSIVPKLYNCILWNNGAAVGPEVYLWDAYASADFYYCDVQGGPELFGGSGGGAGYTGAYENNMDVGPDFEWPSAHDYHLSLNSPLQNMGTPDTTGLHLPATDLEGASRIDLHAQVIDMGCYELQWVGIKAEDDRDGAMEIHIYPNPFRENVCIESPDAEDRDYIAEIYDLTGKKVFSGSLSGSEVFHWDGQGYDGNEVPAGNYFLILRNDRMQLTGTARLIKQGMDR